MRDLADQSGENFIIVEFCSDSLAFETWQADENIASQG